MFRLMLKLGLCFYIELFIFEVKEIVIGLGKLVKLLVEWVWVKLVVGIKGENDMVSMGECFILKVKVYWSYWFIFFDLCFFWFFLCNCN